MKRHGLIAATIAIGFSLSVPGATAHEAIGPAGLGGAAAVQEPAYGSLYHPIAPEVLARLGHAPKAIYISKSNRTLTLLAYGQRVKTFPVAIGKSPDGPKQRQGDGKTPEGLYYMAAHHPNSRFHKALKISYPNVDDARRGVSQGLISPRQANAIRAANGVKALPPQNTRLGRYIEIHGGYQLANTAPGERPWIYAYTDGCIAVTNAMMDEIYHWTPAGAPILIQA